MKYKIFIFLFFLFSCSPHYTKLDNRKSYNASGFAYIFDENDYELKKNKKKLNNEYFQIAHKDLKVGTLIKLINPNTKESIVLKNLKKIDYPDFYKILITKPVALKLKINKELPLIEVLEIKKNKSFIAEKAQMFEEETRIPSKAPVTSVQISNISKKKNISVKKNTQNIYILVASFYTSEAANLLKKRIIKEVPNYDIKKLRIKKRSNKEFEVISGPYKSINLLKNDYIDIKNFGFEELDIFVNE
jgi:hypothetical protein